MAETPRAAGDQLRVVRAAQGILSEADARRGGEDDARLDSFASASAGLMQLSSAAVATAGGPEPTREPARGPERPLPPGWNRINHCSGLPCYANFRLGVVCWSKPYALGAEAAQLAEPDFTRLVKKHVPPTGIFLQPERAAAVAAGDGPGAAAASASAPAAASPSPQTKASAACGGARATETSGSPVEASDEPVSSKKRKVDVPHAAARASDKASSMSLDAFKRLAVDDPRVLQGCMELAIKTPAQVLQEYQNRNRGVSINYNTVPSDRDGVKLFKTIVTAGATVAEGVASTKKIAKQLGAQQLLALLHERTARTYMQVAELYSSSSKGQSAVAESGAAAAPLPAPVISFASGQAISNSLRSVGTPGRIADARFPRVDAGSSGIHSLGAGVGGVGIGVGVGGGGGSAGVGGGSRLRKLRRPSPPREYGQRDDEYADGAGYGGPSQWEAHPHDGAASWRGEEGGHADSPGPERIVVYSSPTSSNNNNNNNSSSSYGSPYYTAGHAPWAFAPPRGLSLPPPPHQTPLPSVHRLASDADRGAAGASRQFNYGEAYGSRSSDRSSNAKQSQARYRSHPPA